MSTKPKRTTNVRKSWIEVEVDDAGGFRLIAKRWHGLDLHQYVLHLDDYQASDLSDAAWRVVQRREKQAQRLRANVAEEPAVKP